MEIVAHLEGLTPHFESEHRVQHRDGSWRWMLCRGLAVRDESGRAYRFAGSLTDITDRKLLEQQVYHDAFHDALTGLPNRALFMDRAGRAVERSKRNPAYAFAVLVVDIDRFKVVNDGLGYRAGDEVIRDAATRIARCLRPEDTVARLGGDEFALLLEDLTDISDATRVATRIGNALPAPSGPHQLVLSASAGIALSATGYECAEDLLRDADIALRRAKAGGRGRYEIFDPAMHHRALALLETETDLRRGLERNEFLVYYQPIVAIGTRRLAGFEALLRWRHPTRGIVHPVDFVAVAEETGLIVSLGEWILREACRQASDWRDCFGVDLTVSVNLSGRQLTEPDIVERVARILEETGLPGEHLGLEVTESVLMDNLDSATEKLHRLKELGVRVALDDFGTGYSSFSLLHRFPIDTLKLDRSFVARIPGPGSPTVRAIVALAHNLGMQVVAEGVETAAQREALAGLDCAFGQGHLFSEAVPPVRAAELIATAPQW
jgi:diguanylate cyclase (GGDEF)-like protein